MQFFFFPLLNPICIKLTKTVSFKPLSLPRCCPIGSFVVGDAGGGGDGFCVGGVVGLNDCTICMVLSGQSRLAEVQF